MVAEVKAFLRSALRQRLRGGNRAERIVVDPGFGFGKTLEHNLELLRDSTRIRRARGAGARRLVAQVLARQDHRQARRRPARCEHCRGADRGAEWRYNPARARRRGDARRACGACAPLTKDDQDMTRKYFGTDGIRGRVGEPPITPDFVMRLGYRRGRGAGARGAAAGRAAGGADRQGHAHLRLHARGGAGGGVCGGRAWTCMLSGRCRRRPWPISRARCGCRPGS